MLLSVYVFANELAYFVRAAKNSAPLVHKAKKAIGLNGSIICGSLEILDHFKLGFD